MDKATGETISHYEDVISNIAVSQDHVYFITSDASLLVINIETGKLLEEVSFGPEITDKPYPTTFLVAAEEDWLIVYFGDSQQLFGFKVL